MGTLKHIKKKSQIGKMNLMYANMYILFSFYPFDSISCIFIMYILNNPIYNLNLNHIYFGKACFKMSYKSDNTSEMFGYTCVNSSHKALLGIIRRMIINIC